MPYVIARKTLSGEPRFAAMYYDADGKARSAGTYGTHGKALEMATKQEDHARRKLASTSPAEKATITVRQFFAKYLAEHGIDPLSKQSYALLFRLHVLPYIGHMRLAEVDNEIVTRLLNVVLVEAEVGPSSIAHTRTALGSMFTMARNQGYISGDSPTKGIRLVGGPRKGRAKKIIKVYTPEQYGRVRAALPSKEAQRFSLLIANSGVRFCEAISLTPADINPETGLMTVSKSTVEVSAEFHPTGGRFLTKDYTKTGDQRAFTIDLAVARAVHAHAEEHGIGPDELLWPIWFFTRQREPVEELSEEELEALRQTTFRAKVVSPRTGMVSERIFRHATLSGSRTGKCKCRGCRQVGNAYDRARAASKRQERRGARRVPRRQAGEPHLGRDVWRRIWVGAVEKAGLEYIPPYDIRHCHASWLMDGGESLATIQARLGHNDISTTTRYLTVVDQKSTSSAKVMSGLMDGWGEL